MILSIVALIGAAAMTLVVWSGYRRLPGPTKNGIMVVLSSFGAGILLAYGLRSVWSFSAASCYAMWLLVCLGVFAADSINHGLRVRARSKHT